MNVWYAHVKRFAIFGRHCTYKQTWVASSAQLVGVASSISQKSEHKYTANPMKMNVYNGILTERKIYTFPMEGKKKKKIFLRPLGIPSE